MTITPYPTLRLKITPQASLKVRFLPSLPTGGYVSTFNGRSGAVVPVADDYTASKVTFTPHGSVSATNVQGAINAVIDAGGGGGATAFTALTDVPSSYSGSGLYYVRVNAGATALEFNSGGALTKTDDTNVTLTLGGTPTTALLKATSLTLGWTGTLAVARGGTGASTLTGLLQGNGTSAVTAITDSSTVGQVLRVTGSSTYAWGAVNLADTDAVTGALPVGNGGTGATTLTDHGVLLGQSTSAVAATAAMTDGQLLVGQSSANPLPKTVSGDVTMAASGAITIANSAVTYAKIQNVVANQRVLGRTSGAGGVVEEISISASLDWLGNTRGALLRRGSGGWEILPPGTGGQVLTSNGAGADPTYQSVSGTGTVTSVATGYGVTGGPITSSGTVALDPPTLGQLAGQRRRNHNGRFEVDQINGGTATATADNAFFCDRWRYIGEATATLTAAVFGGYSTFGAHGELKFTGTTDKGGVFCVIEGKDCKDLRGSSVTLSALLAVSNTRLGNIKMGIAEFTGTEDSTTGDPISSWGADGTTPTLAANWAFLNTPANLSVTTSAVRYSVTGAVGSSANNLAIFIWNDDKSYNANDVLYFSDVQLEFGTPTTAQIGYERWSYGAELAICKRYYQRFKDATTTVFCVGYCVSTTQATLIFPYEIEMRAAPSLTVANPTNFSVNSGGLNTACTALAANGTPGVRTTALLATIGSAVFTGGDGASLFNTNTNAEVRLSAQI